jgi:hypothetical protein
MKIQIQFWFLSSIFYIVISPFRIITIPLKQPSFNISIYFLNLLFSKEQCNPVVYMIPILRRLIIVTWIGSKHWRVQKKKKLKYQYWIIITPPIQDMTTTQWFTNLFCLTFSSYSFFLLFNGNSKTNAFLEILFNHIFN